MAGFDLCLSSHDGQAVSINVRDCCGGQLCMLVSNARCVFSKAFPVAFNITYSASSSRSLFSRWCLLKEGEQGLSTTISCSFPARPLSTTCPRSRLRFATILGQDIPSFARVRSKKGRNECVLRGRALIDCVEGSKLFEPQEHRPTASC